MELATVPGLTSALRAHGYQVRGPVGVGSSGPAWAAHAPDGARVVVSVLDLDLPIAARRPALVRLEVLARVRHPHLVPLLDVVEIDAHRTALVTAHVEGPSVGAVLALRPRWRAGEVLTLVAPVAGALEALEAEGLRHGDVSPENVVLGPGGTPVLVDLASVVLPPAGTPGFAAPDQADDVFSVGRLGLAALGEQPEEPLHEVLGRACAPDPVTRPGLVELVRECFDVVDAEPIALPDTAILARTALARLAEPTRHEHTVRDPHAARRRRRALGAGAFAAAVAIALGIAVVTSQERPDAFAATEPLASELADAAVALTHRRAELLSALASERLEEVAVPGSPAFEADAALIERLAEHREEVTVRAEGVEARRLGAHDGLELVLVTSRVQVDGGAEAPQSTVVLALERTPEGWRVASVLEPDEVSAASSPAGPLAG